jgi:hypothetical protein
MSLVYGEVELKRDPDKRLRVGERGGANVAKARGSTTVRH